MGFRNRKHDEQRRQRTRRATPDAWIEATCRDELAVIVEWRTAESSTR
jgi:hypothetical protein